MIGELTPEQARMLGLAEHIADNEFRYIVDPYHT